MRRAGQLNRHFGMRDRKPRKRARYELQLQGHNQRVLRDTRREPRGEQHVHLLRQRKPDRRRRAEREAAGVKACPAPSGPPDSLQNEEDQLPSEKELAFEYNEHGQPVASKEAAGNTTKYKYDTKGNLEEIVPPAPLEPTKITVDADSRPHVITDGAKHVETITYDKLDRITEIAYTGTGTAKTIKYEYDADGNLGKREDSINGTTKYTVDQLNRLTKEELPGSKANEYEYNEASDLTAFTDSGGTTKYKYNALNELEGMTEPSATKETTFTYDNDHRLTKITYPSGVSENYKLEENTGRPETITFEGLTGGTVPNLSYTYLSGKNQTSLIQTLKESTSGATTTYKYDPLNRLKEATTASTETGHKAHYNYVLYGNGNRKEQTVNLSGETGGTSTYYLYNAANELECRLNAKETKCPENTTTQLSFYKYDKAGELTAITPKHDTTGSTFAYNAAAELTAITPSGEAEQALAYAGPARPTSQASARPNSKTA